MKPDQNDLFPDALPDWASEGRDPLDRYYTPHWCTETLLQYVEPYGAVWEPCAGAGHISNVLRTQNAARWVYGSDADPASSFDCIDFLRREQHPPVMVPDWVITNPPYTTPTARASDFVRMALDIAPNVAMLLPITFWEGCQDRIDILRKRPPTLCIHLGRVNFVRPGQPSMSPPGDSQWFVWLDGHEDERTTRHIYHQR